MNLRDVALVTAGVIGIGVAVAHGIIIQRRIVRPLEKLAAAMPASSRTLLAGLLQFSTFNWFIGGLALIAAAIWLEHGAKLATGLLAGSSYLYGAVGNFLATRGRHPGWMLYAVALVLIVFGISG